MSEPIVEVDIKDEKLKAQVEAVIERLKNSEYSYIFEDIASHSLYTNDPAKKTIYQKISQGMFEYYEVSDPSLNDESRSKVLDNFKGEANKIIYLDAKYSYGDADLGYVALSTIDMEHAVYIHNFSSNFFPLSIENVVLHETLHLGDPWSKLSTYLLTEHEYNKLNSTGREDLPSLDAILNNYIALAAKVVDRGNSEDSFNDEQRRMLAQRFVEAHNLPEEFTTFFARDFEDRYKAFFSAYGISDSEIAEINPATINIEGDNHNKVTYKDFNGREFEIDSDSMILVVDIVDDGFPPSYIYENVLEQWAVLKANEINSDLYRAAGILEQRGDYFETCDVSEAIPMQSIADKQIASDEQFARAGINASELINNLKTGDLSGLLEDARGIIAHGLNGLVAAAPAVVKCKMPE